MLSSACKLPGIAVGLLTLSLVSLLSSWTGLWWSVELRTVGDSTTHRHVAVAAVDGVNHDAVPSPYVNDNHPHESLTTAEQIEHSSYRPFPRWGDTVPEEESRGIDMLPLLDFIVNSSAHAHGPSEKVNNSYYQPTTDHARDVNYWFPETLYVLDADGLWTSRKHRTITDRGVGSVRDKLVPVEAMAAWRLLHQQQPQQHDDNDHNNNNKKWPRLHQLLVRNNNNNNNNNDDDDENEKQAVGFPYLGWFGDYTGCNRNNWKNGQYSIPLFTNAARVDCNYTIPFPTYQTIRDASHKHRPDEWQHVMQNEYAVQYPWSAKRPQVVWRGSLTGAVVQASQRHPRWRLVQKIHDLEQEYHHNHSNNNDSNDNNHYNNDTAMFLFDVRATRLPRRHDRWKFNTSEVGGILPADQMSMEDFQKYRGILDLDGNSWSSRFGALLCYNSVILKVEPTWVDYFYFPRPDNNNNNRSSAAAAPPQPWKHYIPVAADLSDLVERAAYVADSANDRVLQNMVRKANEWCQQRMIRNRVAHDMLDIWERYIELLDIGTPNWPHTVWSDVKAQIFAPDSPLDMVLLESSSTIMHDKHN